MPLLHARHLRRSTIVHDGVWRTCYAKPIEEVKRDLVTSYLVPTLLTIPHCSHFSLRTRATLVDSPRRLAQCTVECYLRWMCAYF